jgi:cyclopropane-fatty-acyl-phospholipid synthase
MSQTTMTAAVPGVASRFAPRRMLLQRVCAGLRRGTLSIVLPDGSVVRHRAAAPGGDATVILHRWRSLRRLILGGDVAFAESFLDGDWSSPDLTALIELAARNAETLQQATQGSTPARWLNRLLHRMRANTRTGSRRNILAHYDLGNDFYRLWLDAGMTYSSALFTTPGMTLEEAQTAKQDRVLTLLSPRPAAHVLEIGIGWGGMAERMAQAGCQVTGLTLSPSQLTYAQARLDGTSASLHLRDYRDEVLQYDHIVSIEMLEAVGEDYWPAYFAQLKRCLGPGGSAVVQVITIADDRFETYRRTPDFIQRHVFPGGMLPSPAVMRQQVAQAGLAVTAHETFGLDYARTLAEWRRRFERAWPDIAAIGFPPRFRRLWLYYLSYCEAGFRAGALDVGLWRLEHAA